MPDATACRGCGTEVAPDLLNCPSCRQLIHAERLKSLAASAEKAEVESRPGEALRAWREALALLPEDSAQHAAVSKRMDGLGRHAGLEAPPAAPSPGKSTSSVWKGAAGLGGIGLLLWKFKFVFGFLLTKGKLLLLGLTKGQTVFSMVFALGAYWTIWGWAFALGLLLSIYIHEMGHVAMLRRFGIPASAPMFVPGLGAFIRMGHYPITPREDARVGLAGPWWGTGAALAAAAASFAADWPLGAALARGGAWINLFNLLPLWSLDGGRGFRSLTRRQRVLAAAALLTAWILAEESLLLLLLAGAAWRCFEREAPREPDRGTLFSYVLLVAILAALTRLPVPGVTQGF